MNKRKVDWLMIRNVVAFWFFGLCNNYGYVIMLSAAEDIMDDQQHKPASNATKHCFEHLDNRHCTSKSTGAVLIADNLPSLICKLTFPFFMHRIPFGFRHILVCALQASSYLIVAFSANVAMSLAGVAMGSLASGIGEITYLGLSSFFPSSAIAAWASGTGGAGLIGSFAFAFLTEPSMGNLSPKVALLIQSFIPAVFLVIYYVVLSPPDEVYTPGWNPKTWIVPLDHDKKIFETQGEESEYRPQNLQRVPQRKLTFIERVVLVKPLLHLMIPVSLVYIGEYLINQGLTQMIVFNCHRGFGLTLASQYRWYQVLYQLGVFLSRSSVRLFELPQWFLYLLPILQFSNMFLFFFEAIYWFIPHISIIFALIIFEGLLGGSSYVNTFNRIHKTVEPDIREYCLSIATVGDSIGVNLAGFAAIPLHNWVCGMKMPTHNL
ncbi:unnamed protein product [Auanema sp. JU1783]|nr:unnamed protein product [Auanema sp. JU1783]